MELVLINSGIPKFNFAYSMVAMKSWVWITNAQTAPLSREQASHSFPWVASVTNQACRREARGFLTVSSTKRCCSFILAVGCTILRRQLYVAEPSFITQNLSFLHSCRTLGYGILEGDGTDRNPTCYRAAKPLRHSHGAQVLEPGDATTEPVNLELTLYSKRSHCKGKPRDHNQRKPLCGYTAQPETKD